MIPIIRPDLSFDEVADDLRRVIESGWLTGGPNIARFEEAIAKIMGGGEAIAVSSATTALHLTLVAAGIGPGDEVLVSDFSFPASANSIIQAGARPVFVDCLPGRFDLDPAVAASLVTGRTRAIMPVHPFGQPAEMASINALAARYGLLVVEDAACAIGATLNGMPCGGGSGVGCFSFHPRKLITTGEGGAVTTRDQTLAKRLRLLRSHAGVPDTVGLRFMENGFNYRLSEIAAVLGLAQLGRLDAILADRRATARHLAERLTGLPGVNLPQLAQPGEGTFQSFVVLLDDDIDRNRVVERMRAGGVETTLGTYAQHAHPAFAALGCKPGDCPHSLHAQNQSLTLPLLPRMAEDQIDRVAITLVQVLAEV